MRIEAVLAQMLECELYRIHVTMMWPYDRCGVFRRAILRKWKEKKGSEATYGNLVRTCLSNDKKSCADKIVHELINSQSSIV